MDQCPKCNGSGRVVSSQYPTDAYKVGAGMGMHRCDSCHGQGFVHGASGSGGGQQRDEDLIAIVAPLFQYPVFSFIGFWLICTALLLLLENEVGGTLSLNMDPIWFYISAMGISGVLTVVLRKIVPATMKWVFFVTIGAIGLAIGLVLIRSFFGIY